MCCSALQCVCCSVSFSVAMCHWVLKCVAMCHCVLKCVFVCCNVPIRVKHVDPRTPPPPEGVSFVGGFQMKSLEKEEPPGNNPNFGEKFGLFWKGSPLPPG